MLKLLRRLFGLEKKANTRKDSPVPYWSRFDSRPLQPGQSLIIRGFVIRPAPGLVGSNAVANESNHGHEQLLINLTAGPCVEKQVDTDELDDRLLSLRADMANRKVFINACINNQWGKEGVVKKTWKSNDEFDIRIRCHEEEFAIFLDHKLVATFAHYVPLSKITHIYINGDVELYNVTWEGKYYQVPYTADIPGNFYPGRKLYFSGMLKEKAKQFSIDLYADKDIALRIQPHLSDKRLSRNTRIDANWGSEETKRSVFPFKKGKEVDVTVSCVDNEFQIYVDDILLCNYTHRIPPAQINKINIEGDLEIHGVHLK